MKKLYIEKYSAKNKEDWDHFVLTRSINGTFLQTMQFLSYHPPGRFQDHSLIIRDGKKEIVCVIPAAEVVTDGSKHLFASHPGSTFGGIIVHNQANKGKSIDSILTLLEDYLHQKSFNEAIIKTTPAIFCRGNDVLIEYFLYKNDFVEEKELSSYIDYQKYDESIVNNFNNNRSRNLKDAMQHNLSFEKLNRREEIQALHAILAKNLEKFNKTPVHGLEELFELKNNIIPENVEFYGLKTPDMLIAGCMAFKFDKLCFHTQYLAMDYEYADMHPMTQLLYELIRVAHGHEYRYFSFGKSTESSGKELNQGLFHFKESFGAGATLNKIYRKTLKT